MNHRQPRNSDGESRNTEEEILGIARTPAAGDPTKSNQIKLNQTKSNHSAGEGIRLLERPAKCERVPLLDPSKHAPDPRVSALRRLGHDADTRYGDGSARTRRPTGANP